MIVCRAGAHAKIDRDGERENDFLQILWTVEVKIFFFFFLGINIHSAISGDLFLTVVMAKNDI